MSNTTDNGIKDAVDWTGAGIDLAGASATLGGESRVASLFEQGVGGGTSGNYLLTGRNLALFGNASMTSASAPTSLLTNIGKGVGNTATVISAGVLVYEGYQVSQGQMDGGRFSYHLGSFGAGVGVGFVYGGPAGSIVGVAAKGAEMSYDVFKEAIMTINGQFQNLINIHR